MAKIRNSLKLAGVGVEGRAPATSREHVADPHPESMSTSDGELNADAPEFFPDVTASIIQGFWDVFIDSVAQFSWDECLQCRVISSITVPDRLMCRWTVEQIIDAAVCPGCQSEVCGSRCFACFYATNNALFECRRDVTQF